MVCLSKKGVICSGRWKTTAEDVDLDSRIAFDKLGLIPHQQPLNYLCDHEPIILKAIKEIRSKKSGSDKSDHRSAFCCNDYVRNERFDTFYEDYFMKNLNII